MGRDEGTIRGGPNWAGVPGCQAILLNFKLQLLSVEHLPVYLQALRSQRLVAAAPVQRLYQDLVNDGIEGEIARVK